MNGLTDTLHSCSGDDTNGPTRHRHPVESAEIDRAAQGIDVRESDEMRWRVERAVPDRGHPRGPHIIVGVGTDDEDAVTPISDAVVVYLALPYHSAPARR